MYFNLQFTNNCYDADKGTEKFNKAVKITLNKQKLQKAGIFSTQGFLHTPRGETKEKMEIESHVNAFLGY